MNHAAQLLAQAMQQCPLVAILRGLTPQEAPAIGQALADAGLLILEVPLNSPDPLKSIALLSAAHPDRLVGAGTVYSAEQVRDIHAAGGRLIVSPHWDPAVVRQALDLEMACIPGVATPSEAFAAWQAGAHALKLFPAGSALAAGGRHRPGQYGRLLASRRARLWHRLGTLRAGPIGRSSGRIGPRLCSSLAGLRRAALNPSAQALNATTFWRCSPRPSMPRVITSPRLR
jgi:hypothetical protein